MCDDRLSGLEHRRSIKNKATIVIVVLMALIGAFEFGKMWAVKDQFAEPNHLGWSSFCHDLGGDYKMCACVEKQLVDKYGKKVADGVSIEILPFFQGCMTPGVKIEP